MKFLAQPIVSWYRGLLRHSQYRWVVILGTLAYLVSPVDLVTDMIPVAGWIDDGLLATVLVAEVSQLLLEQRRERQAKRLKSSSPSVQ